MLLVHEGHVSARKFFTPANALSYDAVVRYATFGKDAVWKRHIIEAIGRRDSVLELACGTGILASMLDGAGKDVTGLDLTFEYLQAARHKLQLTLAQGTAESLPYRDGSFDAVVSSYLAKYVDVQMAAGECWRVLRQGGIAVFHDFTYPAGVVRSTWNLYFHMLQVAGIFVASWRTVFEQLDDIIRKSNWVGETQQALRDKGFRNVSRRYFTAGTACIISAKKP